MRWGPVQSQLGGGSKGRIGKTNRRFSFSDLRHPNVSNLWWFRLHSRETTVPEVGDGPLLKRTTLNSTPQHLSVLISEARGGYVAMAAVDTQDYWEVNERAVLAEYQVDVEEYRLRFRDAYIKPGERPHRNFVMVSVTSYEEWIRTGVKLKRTFGA